METFNNVKKQDMSKLKFNDLWLAHPDTLGHTRIRAYPICHQCAVRMSRSVIKAGVDFSDYPDPTCRGKGNFQG